MVDRVKSNSMEQVFHAIQTSPNINFKNYAPKDEYNLMGARELSDAVKAMIESNYNTGGYVVEYSDAQKSQARSNINSASNSVNFTVYSDNVPYSYNNVSNVNGSVLNCYGFQRASKNSSTGAILARTSLRSIISSGKAIITGLDFAKRLKDFWSSCSFAKRHNPSKPCANSRKNSSFYPRWTICKYCPRM